MAAQTPSRRSGLGVPGSTDGSGNRFVDKPHRDVESHVGAVRSLAEQVEIAQDQRALGQDRERVGRVAQRGDDAGHQPVPALGPLVAIHVGAHRDVLALPARGGELAPREVRRIDLDHDLGVEVVTGIHVQVRMRIASEAVVTDDAVRDEVAGAGRHVVHGQI
ncbi:MAG: hypothetical protein ACRDOK_23845 [Streptosporangiaceae bacterium]